jgi:hypothetical protein
MATSMADACIAVLRWGNCIDATARQRALVGRKLEFQALGGCRVGSRV